MAKLKSNLSAISLVALAILIIVGANHASTRLILKSHQSSRNPKIPPAIIIAPPILPDISLAISTNQSLEFMQILSLLNVQ